MNEFAQKYIDWLKANGVDQAPSVEVGNGDPVPGYAPPTYLVFKNGTGILKQAIQLLEIESRTGSDLNSGIQALFFVTGQTALRVSWQQFNKPTVAVSPAKDPMVGDHFRDDLYYVVGSGVQEGSTYTRPTDNAFFICVANGMFDRKWKLVA